MEKSIFKTCVEIPFKIGDYIVIDGKRERINGMLIYVTRNSDIHKVRFQVGYHHQITIPCYLKCRVVVHPLDVEGLGLSE